MLVLYACTDFTEVAAPRAKSNSIRLGFRPDYAFLGNASYVGDPINRIRLTARNQSTGEVVGSLITDVDPNAQDWNLTLDVNLTSQIQVVVTIELIHVTGGVESVQWSGRTDPIDVAPAQPAQTAAPVTLYQGPPANLLVTAVTISPDSAALQEGGTVQLGASASGSAGAQVTWSSSDPSVATVSQSGLVTGLRNGSVSIFAVAGPRADTARVRVAQRVNTVVVAPDTQRLASLGADATFTAGALDPRGATVAGAGVTWTIENAAIADALGDGKFRAKANGVTRVIATSVANPTARGTGVLLVAQKPAHVELTPATASLSAVGAHHAFSATVTDANGKPFTTPLQWRSSNPAVATVDATGVATSVANGTADIVVIAGTAPDTASGHASLKVAQTVETLEVSPTTAAVNALGDTVPFTILPKDSNGNLVPGMTAVWSSANPQIATINSSGVATATANGVGVITAQVGTKRASATVNVAQRAASVTLAPNVDTLGGIGQTLQLSARAADRRGNVLSGRRFTWSSSNPAVLTVDSTGLATAVTLGMANVTVAIDNLSASGSFIVRQVVAQVNAVAGDSQTATVNQDANDSVAVQVRDASGHGIPGLLVTWSPLEGSVSASPADAFMSGIGMRPLLAPITSRTNASGVARAKWKLGIHAGQQSLQACVENSTCVVFHARGRADKAKHAAKNSNTDNQNVTVDQIAANALELTVTDDYGNPTRGTVEWSVASGHGSIGSGNTLVTAIDTMTGKAIVSWRMPTRKGSYTVNFTVKDETGATVASDVFHATAKPDAPNKHVHGAHSDDQVVTVNQPVPNALELAVTDQFDNPIAGAAVNFALHSGHVEATLSATTATTDSLGKASTSWSNIGKKSGLMQVDYTVTFAGATLSGSFKATAKAGRARNANKKSSADNQLVTVSQTAPNALELTVTDEFGNPAAGSVTWRIGSGHGSIGGADSVSTALDAGGKATITWTMPTRKGSYTVNYTVKDDSGSVVVTDAFHATAKPDVPNKHMHKSGSDDQSVVVNSSVPNALELTVSDSFGNAIEGALVRFSVSDTTAHLSANADTTDSLGVAGVSWTNIGKKSGPVRVDYTITFGSTTLTGSFRATARAGKARNAAKNSGADNQLVTVNQTAPNALELTVTDEFGNPAAGSVTWRIGSGHGSIGGADSISTALDASGMATITWTMPTRKGSYTVNYTVKDETGATVASDAFHATAKPDVPNKHVHGARSDDQVVTVNQPVPNALELTVTDQFDNPIAGAAVNFALHSGHVEATLSATTATTDSLGKASTSWSNIGKKSGLMQVDYTVTFAGATLSGSFKATAKAGRARNANKKSGADNQLVTVNQTAPNALELTVTDEFGNPAAGLVTWRISSGHGSIGGLDSVSTALDAGGKATITWTMPTRKGSYTVNYTVKDDSGSVVVTDAFHATAKPDVPNKHVHGARSDDQVVTVNQPVPNALELTVTDQFDNPIEGAVVQFSVSDTTAHLSAASVTTDSLGRASTSWSNVGKKSGAVTVSYTVTLLGTTYATGTFTAHARAGIAKNASKNTSSDNQIVTVDRTAPNALELTVTDAYGNPTRGTVAWSAAGGSLGASSTAIDTTTGKATVTWQMPTRKGSYTVTYTVKDETGATVVSDVFHATAKPDVPRNHTHGVGSDSQTVVVNNSAPNALELIVADTFGNSIAGAAVTFAVSDTTARLSVTSTITDSLGHASTTWTNIGKKAGPVVVSYTITLGTTTLSGSFSGTAKPGPLKTIRPAADVITITSLLETVDLVAYSYDEFDNLRTDTVVWSASPGDTSIVGIVNNGKSVQSKKNGTSAAIGTVPGVAGVSATVTVVVSQTASAGLITFTDVSGGAFPTSVAKDSTIQIVASAVDPKGHAVTRWTWTASNANVTVTYSNSSSEIVTIKGNVAGTTAQVTASTPKGDTKTITITVN